MKELPFWIKTVSPCADYEGLIIEGEIFDISLEAIHNKQTNKSKSATFLKSAGILIVKINDSDIYFYGDGKFIISKIQSEEVAVHLLMDLLK